jgi:hypothetical protein
MKRVYFQVPKVSRVSSSGCSLQLENLSDDRDLVSMEVVWKVSLGLKLFGPKGNRLFFNSCCTDVAFASDGTCGAATPLLISFETSFLVLFKKLVGAS